jgi:hypothetical protein
VQQALAAVHEIPPVKESRGYFMGLTMPQRRALTREAAVRYRIADKAGKKRILDEFTATSGYLRKYAISLFPHEGKKLKIRGTCGNNCSKMSLMNWNMERPPLVVRCGIILS